MPATDAEQLLLELINDARLDPLGNAARYIASYSPLQGTQTNIQNALDFFGVDGPALLAGLTALTPAQPLAYNDQLAAAASAHNGAMIIADAQSHQLPGEAGLGARISAQGYMFTSVGENIYAFAEDPLQAHAAFMVDWGGPDHGMQSPPGHRENIMNATLREIGVAVTPEMNAGTQVGPLVITEDLGTRGSSGVFLLGVAYLDSDHNDFYTQGEGLDDLHVSVGMSNTTSAGSGGYSLQTTATGAQTVTLTGAGLMGAATFTTTLANGENIKLDVIDGHILHTSASGTVAGPITELQGLGLTGLTLAAGSGSQTLVGTHGNDILIGGAGADHLDGGDGIDTADYSGAAAAVTVNLADPMQGSGDAAGDTFVSIENVTGTHHDGDLLIGGDGNNTIDGLDGYNILDGGAGNDILIGGADANFMFGGDGDDTLNGGTGLNSMFGYVGNDSMNGGDGGNTINGEDGNDAISGGAGVDYAFGGAGDDTLNGNGAGDALWGDDPFNLAVAGNDTLNGGDGDDGLDGGPGDDVLNGGAGVDWLYGGDGADQLNGGDDTDALFGDAGNDILHGDGGGDLLDGGDGNDQLFGDDGADWLFGQAGDDMLDGGAGGDVLFSGDGNDTLHGGAGNDSLDGGDGDDTLDGGPGTADVLFGGSGADTFLFTQLSDGGDVVRDFNAAEDDTVAIDHAGFMLDGSLAGSALPAAMFESGAGLPADFTVAGPLFYLDTANHGLWFDPTGGTSADIAIVAGFETGVPDHTDIFVV